MISKVKGLLGRGLGIKYLWKGKIIMVVGGTGLFPFLDLINVIFKISILGIVRMAK